MFDVARESIITSYRFAAPCTRQLRLAYATVGEAARGANGQITNAVLLLHGTTGSSEQFLTGDTSIFAPGGALDAQHTFTIIPDALGHGASSRPSEWASEPFPAYGYLDLVALEERVLESLDVRRPTAVIGTSMGGMQAWIWACRRGSCGACVAIASEPVAVHGRNLLWRRILVNALRDGAQLRHMMPIFTMMSRGVRSLEHGLPDRVSADALVETLWRQTNEREKIDVEFEFDASFDYAPDLRELAVPTLAIAFAGDELNPLASSASKRLAHERPDLVRFELLEEDETSDGHATLRQSARWGPLVARFLKSHRAEVE